MQAPAILVVDDDAPLSQMLVAALAGRGWHAQWAADNATALELLGRHLFDVVLLDIQLPDGSGVEVLERIKARDPAVEVVMMTGHPEVESAVAALRLGAYDYLSKPFSLEEMTLLVGRILERSLLRQEVRSLRSRLGEQLTGGEVVATSPAMRTLLETVQKVAGTDSTVVIEGETGTGKELIAAAVHRASPRAGGVFLPVNCGAIPSELAESELFGHVRGAFSGAIGDSPGLFRSADGGTLFLDEVTELPLGLQVKLLRVLQEGEVRPLGATRSYAVDVRIVAASNRPLEKALADGLLRPDLFYRLSVVRLELPPLRERREDIAPLAAHFLRRFNTKFQRRVRGLTPDALAALEVYAFPGNVRELEHLLERAFALGAREEIGLGELPPLATTDATGDLPPLAEAERNVIRRALRKHRQDKDAAAQELGISRRTLYRRLKELRIQA